MSLNKYYNYLLSQFYNTLFPILKLFVNASLLLLFLSSLFKMDAHCAEKPEHKETPSSFETAIKRVTLLPLENLSRSDTAPPDILTLISKELIKKKQIEVISSEKLKKFLFRERVRDFGSINKSTIRQMGKLLGVDGVIISSIDMLVTGENPKISISCRMLSGSNGALIWADHASLAGEDFVTWLGLGKISSLEILTSKAVENIILSFPDKATLVADDTVPFEITQISVAPRIVHSGDKINVEIVFSAVGMIPSRVKVILGNKKKPFFTRGKKKYNDFIYAPFQEGKYDLKIEVHDNKGGISVLESLASIYVDNSPPVVTTYYQNDLFSPNRDGILDTVIFFPYLERPDEIEVWQLIIENDEGTIVREAEGRGELPKALVWRGENNLNSIVKDGCYSFKMEIIDKAGNVAITDPKLITLDKTPPKPKITVDIVAKKGFRFNLNCPDKSGIDRWRLTVRGPSLNINHFFEGQKKIPTSLLWETDISDPANITYSFEARDMAGNTTLIDSRPLQGDLVQEKKLPQDTKKKEAWDSDF